MVTTTFRFWKLDAIHEEHIHMTKFLLMCTLLVSRIIGGFSLLSSSADLLSA